MAQDTGDVQVRAAFLMDFVYSHDNHGSNPASDCFSELSEWVENREEKADEPMFRTELCSVP